MARALAKKIKHLNLVQSSIFESSAKASFEAEFAVQERLALHGLVTGLRSMLISILSIPRRCGRPQLRDARHRSVGREAARRCRSYAIWITPLPHGASRYAVL